jgi:hypothetical protein
MFLDSVRMMNISELYEILGSTVVKIWNLFFLVVAPHNHVGGYESFKEMYYALSGIVLHAVYMLVFTEYGQRSAQLMLVSRCEAVPSRALL